MRTDGQDFQGIHKRTKESNSKATSCVGVWHGYDMMQKAGVKAALNSP
jgi:hypothetical protein